jgi:hypothetical protein
MKQKASLMILLGLLLVFLNFSCKFTQSLPDINYINIQETFEANPQTVASTISEEETTEKIFGTKIDTNKIKNVSKNWDETLTNAHSDNATKENIIKFSQPSTKSYNKETGTFNQNSTNLFGETDFEKTIISNNETTKFDFISSKSSLLNYKQGIFFLNETSFTIFY